MQNADLTEKSGRLANQTPGVILKLKLNENKMKILN